jgi:hypothetical protein
MFWIIGADGAAKALAEMLSGKGMIPSTAGNIIDGQFEHAEWEGLRFYDLIFPLFIFVTGVAIVFSLMRETRNHETGTSLHQLNSVPSIHMRCRMTASLRATATLAFRSPFRLASLIPQAFSADHFGTRVSSTPAASKR